MRLNIQSNNKPSAWLRVTVWRRLAASPRVMARRRVTASFVTFMAVFMAASSAGVAGVIPSADPAFTGKIAGSDKESTPEWPKPVTAPKGAPNIVLIMTDDTG